MSNLPLPKPSLIEVALEAVRRIQAPLLLFWIVESALLIVLMMTGQDVPDALVPLAYLLPVLAVIVAAAYFALEFIKVRASIKQRLQLSLKPNSTELVLRDVFDRSDGREFRNYVEEQMLKAHRLVLIGTGLNILNSESFTLDLMKRALEEGDFRLEIYLADPANPAVETRLIEEESGGTKPTVGRNGIWNRLDMLLRLWRQFGRSEDISIRLFTHYPTFALMIVDEEYFIYPYGYATLGNFSPVLRFSKGVRSDKCVIDFLDQQYARVKENASDAEMAIRIRRNSRSRGTKGLYPFALYFVPPENSDLYRCGSQVLGYDIRNRCRRGSPASWRAYPALTNLRHKVGDARDFGFHLTLSDALYFISESGVRSVWEEVKFLVRDFEPFDLADLRLKPGFPDAKSISIVVDDPSGSLEALHCELVHRVYRRAQASNYTLGLAGPSRDQDIDRSRLMISRYKAPYVLQRFRPHFTLLTNVPVGEQEGVCLALERVFHEQGCERTMRVRKLARMSMEEKWVIAEEVKLG